MKNLVRATNALMVTLTVFTSVLVHATVISQSTVEQIRSAIEGERNKDKIPGITYAVFSDTGLLTSGALGIARADSIFRMASVSKLFTTLSVHDLIQRGVLRTDMRLLELSKAKFVRFLKKHETAERLESWSKITIGQLLSHQSGISKDVPGALAFFNTESLAHNTYPTEREFYAGLTKVEFLFPAGEVLGGFKYSNLGMNLLGRIVEAYNPEKLKFADYVHKRILSPLKMNDTYYDVPAAKRAQMIAGFGALQPNGIRTPVPKAYFAGYYEGSIGVAATATDLAKLGAEFLKLTYGSSRIIKSEGIVRDLFTLKSPASPSISWASGVLWQTLPGEAAGSSLWAGHTGTGTSERTIVLVSPEKNLGVVVLFDVADANREKYVKLISDIIQAPSVQMPALATELVSNARAYLASIPEPKPVIPAKYFPTSDLDTFVGSYYADVVGTQKITLSDDGYLVFYGQKLIVENVKQGRFRFPPIPGPAGALFSYEPIQFDFDSMGKPTGMRVANVNKFARIN